MNFFTAVRQLLTAPDRERKGTKERRVEVIRILAAYAEVDVPPPLVNQAVRDGWPVGRFETELEKLKANAPATLPRP